MYATAAEAKGAGVCSRDGNFKFLLSYSNYKCGNGGIFLLDLAGMYIYGKWVHFQGETTV